MPTVSPNTGSLVLLTGGNGFIGIWVFKLLLEQGYRVKAAVRSLEKSKRLQEKFASYADKIEWVVVEDMTKDAAFDDAVKELDAIVHMASPVDGAPGAHPDEYIKPAVAMTTSILNSALKFGSKLQRFVFTSSCAAVMSTVEKPTKIFTEEDWGDEFVEVCRAKGKEAPERFKYRASKVLAERAAWTFVEENKGKISWDLVTLAPPLVFGPTLLDPKKPEDLNLSLSMWWAFIAKDSPDDVLKSSFSVIDVRDLATAHVASLGNEKAGGERLIISNDWFVASGPHNTYPGVVGVQETRDIIASLKPALYTNGILPRGKPELERVVLLDFDGEKGKRVLGLKYRSVEETIADTVADFEARGWFEKPVF